MATEKEDPATTHRLSLKGSAKLVAEFFEYSIQTILYQRGVYPAEDFTPVRKYGLAMLVASDDGVKRYLRRIMSQLRRWMLAGKVKRVVVVICEKEAKAKPKAKPKPRSEGARQPAEEGEEEEEVKEGDDEVVERWEFGVDLLGAMQPDTATSATATATAAGKAAGVVGKENAGAEGEAAAVELDRVKSEAEVQREIAALFRQITASVTFLPQLEGGGYTFNVLVYADAESEVPVEWGDSDAREVRGGEKVKLRGFSTESHRVGTSVAYRVGD